MGRKNTTGTKAMCNHCKYIWLTNSEANITSCPRCGWRVRLKNWNQQTNSTGLRFKIFLRDCFTCQYCGKTIKDGIQLNIDHIIPVSKGGINLEDNLITCCNICNISKKDYKVTDNEFYKIKSIEKPNLSKEQILELIP